MPKGKPITVKLFYKGQEVKTLPEDVREKMAQKLSETLSDYYTRHPEEFLRIRD